MLDVPVDTIKDILYKDKYPSFPKAIKMIVNGRMVSSLQEIAELMNCAVVELPEVDTTDPLHVKQIAKAMKEFSEFIEAHAEAIKDKQITKEEKEQIKKEGWEAIASILQVILSVEVER